MNISTADKETTPLIAFLKKCFRSHRGPRLVLAVARIKVICFGVLKSVVQGPKKGLNANWPRGSDQNDTDFF